MFNSWHPKGQRGLIYTICQFPSCKYSHYDHLQATSMMSLNTEMEQEVHHRVSEAGPSQFQHGTRGSLRALETVPLSYKDPLPTPLLLILQSLPITSAMPCPTLVPQATPSETPQGDERTPPILQPHGKSKMWGELQVSLHLVVEWRDSSLDDFISPGSRSISGYAVQYR